jgi:hypothetical protein
VALTDPHRQHLQGQFVGHRLKYFQRKRSSLDPSTITTDAIRDFEQAWSDPQHRMDVVPGKDVFAAFCGEVQHRYQVSLSKSKLISEFRREEIPFELVQVLRQLDRFGGER